MPAPSKTWTDVTDSMIDSDSTTKEGELLTYLSDQLVYLNEITINDNSYTGELPHTHDTNAIVSGPANVNLVLESALTKDPGTWTRSASIGEADEDGLGLTWFRVSTASPRTATLNDYAYHQLLQSTTLDPWGASGTAVTLSMFAKMTATSTAGKISLGLADGGGTPPTYKTDHKMQLTAASHLGTAWKHFFTVLDGGSTSGLPMSSHATDATLAIIVEETFDLDVQVIVTGIMAHSGVQLQPWFWGPTDQWQENFERVPQAPLLEFATAFEDSEEITPS